MKSIINRDFVRKIPASIQGIVYFLNLNFDTIKKSYIVGGACRNFLLNKEVIDYDIATPVTPEQIKEKYPEANIVGNNFLVTLIDGIEISTFRKDRSDHAVVANTLKEDVTRRDFTINAIAYDVVGESFIDHVGGLEDLSNRVLKCVGEPEKRFLEDPARILRGIRFASTYNLTIEKETYFEMFRLRELIKEIPGERIQLEVIKAFKSNNTHRFLTLLEEMEMLELVFPSIAKLRGIDGGDYHREIVLHHCFNAVKAIEEKHWELKLAALYHDVGKQFPLKNDKGFNTFKAHNLIGVGFVVYDLKDHLKFSNELVDYVKYLCLLHMDFIVFDCEKNIKKTYTKLLEKNIPLRDFIYLRYADTKGNAKNKNTFYNMWRMYRRFLEVINKKPPFCIKDLDVSGSEIMDLLEIIPGRLVGEILRDVFEKVQEDLLNNEKSTIFEYVLDNYGVL